MQLDWVGCAAAHAQSWVWDYFVWSCAWSGMEVLSGPKHIIQASDFSRFWPCVGPFVSLHLFKILDLPSLGHFIFLLADSVLIFLLKAKAKVQQDLQDCMGRTGLLEPGPMDKIALSAWESLAEW